MLFSNLLISITQLVLLLDFVYMLPEFNKDTIDIKVTPEKQTIVLLGKKKSIDVYCSDQLTHEFCIKASLQENKTQYPVRILTDGSFFEANTSDIGASHAAVEVLGLRPGRVKLKLQLLHSNHTELGTLDKDYEVIVAEQLNIIHDAFVYILCTIQFLGMLLLGLRMRGAAAKEIIVRPCALITALMAQTVFVPLVYLGASVILSLDEHATIALLLIGCCPTAVVGAMMAVVQQAHVELAIILLLLQTVTTFGTMPGWLFTYGHFLGVAYNEVSFPYFHITAAVGGIAFPTVLGICLRRCTPRVLPQLDKAIQPVSLLVVMVAVTVSIYNFMEKWALITWDLLVATSCIPLACLLLGTSLCAVTKQKVPQLKAVAMATALQNTLLTTTIIQTSYPAEVSSVMAVTIACVDLTSLSILFILYLIHIVLWVTWPMYRMNHDNIGISGISKSFSERLVRNMLKAGEIRFCSRVNNKKKQHDPDGTPFCNSSLATISNSLSGNGGDKTCINNNSLAKTMSKRMASLNLSFLGTLQTKVEFGDKDTGTMNSEESELSLQYFVTPQPKPGNKEQKVKSDEANKDSPSINYDIMVQKDSSLQRHAAVDQIHTTTTPCTNNNTTLVKSLDSAFALHSESMKRNLEIIKQLDKTNGYINCTGKGLANEVCECAAEETENTTNDVIEILVATTMPPIVQVENQVNDSPDINDNQQVDCTDGQQKLETTSQTNKEDLTVVQSEKDTSIWFEEKL